MLEEGEDPDLLYDDLHSLLPSPPAEDVAVNDLWFCSPNPSEGASTWTETPHDVDEAAQVHQLCLAEGRSPTVSAGDEASQGAIIDPERPIVISFNSYQDPAVHNEIYRLFEEYASHRQTGNPFTIVPVFCESPDFSVLQQRFFSPTGKPLLQGLFVIDKRCPNPDPVRKVVGGQKPTFPGPTKVREEARTNGERVFRRGASNAGRGPLKPWRFDLTDKQEDFWVCLVVPFTPSERQSGAKRRRKISAVAQSGSSEGGRELQSTSAAADDIVTEDLIDGVIQGVVASGRLSGGEEQLQRYRTELRRRLERTVNECTAMALQKTEWADQVFTDATYRQHSVAEVEQFTQAEGHLPWIRKEAEVMETGIDPCKDLRDVLEGLENAWLCIFALNRRVGGGEARALEHGSGGAAGGGGSQEVVVQEEGRCEDGRQDRTQHSAHAKHSDAAEREKQAGEAGGDRQGGGEGKQGRGVGGAGGRAADGEDAGKGGRAGGMRRMRERLRSLTPEQRERAEWGQSILEPLLPAGFVQSPFWLTTPTVAPRQSVRLRVPPSQVVVVTRVRERQRAFFKARAQDLLACLVPVEASDAARRFAVQVHQEAAPEELCSCSDAGCRRGHRPEALLSHCTAYLEFGSAAAAEAVAEVLRAALEATPFVDALPSALTLDANPLTSLSSMLFTQHSAVHVLAERKAAERAERAEQRREEAEQARTDEREEEREQEGDGSGMEWITEEEWSVGEEGTEKEEPRRAGGEGSSLLGQLRVVDEGERRARLGEAEAREASVRNEVAACRSSGRPGLATIRVRLQHAASCAERTEHALAAQHLHLAWLELQTAGLGSRGSEAGSAEAEAEAGELEVEVCLQLGLARTVLRQYKQASTLLVRAWERGGSRVHVAVEAMGALAEGLLKAEGRGPAEQREARRLAERLDRTVVAMARERGKKGLEAAAWERLAEVCAAEAKEAASESQGGGEDAGEWRARLVESLERRIELDEVEGDGESSGGSGSDCHWRLWQVLVELGEWERACDAADQVSHGESLWLVRQRTQPLDVKKKMLLEQAVVVGARRVRFSCFPPAVIDEALALAPILLAPSLPDAHPLPPGARSSSFGQAVAVLAQLCAAEDLQPSLATIPPALLHQLPSAQPPRPPPSTPGSPRPQCDVSAAAAPEASGSEGQVEHWPERSRRLEGVGAWWRLWRAVLGGVLLAAFLALVRRNQHRRARAVRDSRQMLARGSLAVRLGVCLGFAWTGIAVIRRSAAAQLALSRRLASGPRAEQVGEGADALNRPPGDGEQSHRDALDAGKQAEAEAEAEAEAAAEQQRGLDEAYGLGLLARGSCVDEPQAQWQQLAVRLAGGALPALHRCSFQGEVQGVATLLRASADVGLRVRVGDSMAALGPSRSHSPVERTALHLALMSHQRVPQYVLGQLQPEEVRGRSEVVARLLAARAGVEERDSAGYTPLMLAADAKDPDAIRLLLQAGASKATRHPHPPRIMMTGDLRKRTWTAQDFAANDDLPSWSADGHHPFARIVQQCVELLDPLV